MLLGRETEQATLEGLIAGARSGGRWVAADHRRGWDRQNRSPQYARSQAADMKVLTTRGVASELTLSFSALDYLVRPILSWLAEVPAPRPQH